MIVYGGSGKAACNSECFQAIVVALERLGNDETLLVQTRQARGGLRWRYIRYNDGAEEVYDHQTDPLEWTNVAWEPGSARVTKELASWLPRCDAANSPAEETIPDRKF